MFYPVVLCFGIRKSSFFSKVIPVSLKISEIPANKSSSLCPEPIDDQEVATHRVSQTNFCHIKEFNHSVSCTRFPDNSCVFDDFPYNCDAILNDIEVILQCYGNLLYGSYNVSS